MADSVSLADISKAFNVVMDGLRSHNIEKISFKNGAYWYVGGTDGQNIYNEVKTSLGDYGEDIKTIRNADRSVGGIPYNLAQSLSAVLHYISILHDPF